jgi:hypothetical protein
VCKCGQGKTYRRAGKKRNGEAVARLVGECEKCKSISLTAGEWRLFENKKAVAKLEDGEEYRTDWRIGNPLTYFDPVSERYGSARYGHGEGFHGALVTRFGLLREKAWYSDRRQAERDVMQVFCIMHGLAKHQRRVAAGGDPSIPVRGAGPPPLPLARAA